MTIVITGATGNVGRPLVAELATAGARVRAVTRHRRPPGFPAGVEPSARRPKHYPARRRCSSIPARWARTLRRRGSPVRPRGVTKLVALSAINADDDFSRQPSRFRGDRNKEVEQLAVDSGLAWVSLRPAVFASNFAGMWSAQIRAGDVVGGPYAAASSAPIVESDISAVAARALLTDDLVGQRIPLTGPQALTNAELVGDHRRRARPATALPGGAARRGPAAVHRLGFPRRVRRRLRRDARRHGRQARAGDP